MNTFRKINTIAVNSYQMLYNLAVIIGCLIVTGLWLYYLIRNTTPWNGIDENDAWGVLVFGFLFGIGMVFIFASLIFSVLLTVLNIVSIIQFFRAKKRKTGFIFAMVNTAGVFLSAVVTLLSLVWACIPGVPEGIWSVLLYVIATGEIIAILWNGAGFVLHLCTDIPYFASEKKAKQN